MMRDLTKTGGKIFYIYTHARPDGSIFYVGKGVGDRARDFWNRGEHHKRVVSKYGEQNIVVEAYAVFDEVHAYALERQLILAMRKAGIRLINQDDGGRARIGVTISPEHREKLRQALMGHPVSDETRARQRAAGLGRKLAPAIVEKMKQRKLGDEHKAALLRAITGRQVSEETKAKIRKANTGRKLSDEHRAKLREARARQPRTEEESAKRSAAIRAGFARKRQSAEATA